MATGGSAAKTMQPEVEEEDGPDGEIERAGAEAVKLPTVHHKAWEAERLRALNGVLGEEL